MKQADSNYKWKIFLGAETAALFLIGIPSYIIYMILALKKSLDSSSEIILALTAVIFIIITIFSWLYTKWAHQCYKYEIGPKSLKKESGVIWKKYTNIPYARVQNIDIERGALDRILGLSCLIVQTAGSSSPYSREGEIPGLAAETAGQLMEELTQRIENFKNNETTGL